MKTAKHLRTALAALLTLALLCGTTTAAFAANALNEAITFPDGALMNVMEFVHEYDYDYYYLNRDGTKTTDEQADTYAVSIRRLSKRYGDTLAGYMYIPETYRGYPVVRVERFDAYNNHILGIRYPKTITTIDLQSLDNSPYLRWIEVDPENPYYFSVDGVLYQGNTQTGSITLSRYPQWKQDTEFITFPGASSIQNGAFANNPYLQKLTIAGSTANETDLRSGAVSGMSALQTLVFGEGVASVNRNAVTDCPNLTTVHIASSMALYAQEYQGAGNAYFGFLSGTGTTSLTVCTVYTTDALRAAVQAAGATLSFCGGVHTYPAQPVEYPDQPLPPAQEVYSTENFWFSPIADEGTITGYALIGLLNVPDYPVSAIIPAQYNGKPVTTIRASFVSQSNYLVAVTIPASVQMIETYALANENLTEITVDETNPVYRSIDGALYTADGETLVQYPAGREDDSFAIPDGVKAVSAGAFTNAVHLRTLTLPQSFTDVTVASKLVYLTALERIVVDPDNITLEADEYGVLYTKNRADKHLLRYPSCGEASYTLPQDVDFIGEYALQNMVTLRFLMIADDDLTNPPTVTPMANLERVSTPDDSVISLHIPPSVRSFRLTSIPKTEMQICCGTSGSQAAAFAAAYDIPFKICSDDHTVLRDRRSTDPIIPELEADTLQFAFEWVTSVGAYGLERIDGVALTDLNWDMEEPYTLTIPESYQGYPVVKLGAFSGAQSIDGGMLRRLEIPETVTEIVSGAFTGFAMLGEIAVDRDNPAYSAVDNVLFNKDKTALVLYPADKTVASYAIPYGVRTIAKNAFSANKHLLHLSIPVSMDDDSFTVLAALRNLGSLQSYDAEPGNATYYSDMYGVLYQNTTEGKNLIDYPIGKTDTAYAIAEGTTLMNSNALHNNAYLQTVTLPTSYGYENIPNLVKTLQIQTAFYNLPSLREIRVANGNVYYTTDEYGVLYNADQTTLICYPPDAPMDIYTLPKTVSNNNVRLRIAFTYAKNLRVLCLEKETAEALTGTILAGGTSYTNGIAHRSPVQYLHIPSDVTQIGFTISDPSLTICSDARSAPLEAFAEENGINFAVCNAAHTEFTVIEPGTPDNPDNPDIPDNPDDPDDPPQPTGKLMLTVSGGTARPGETVAVTVNVTENPGLASLRLFLAYHPDVLTLTAVQNGSVLGTEILTCGNDFAAIPYTVLWNDALTHSDYTGTGTLVTYIFTVNDNAEAGETSVAVGIDPVSTFNAAMQSVDYAIGNGSVTVYTRVAGDANGDGQLDLKDVIALRRFLAGGWNDLTVDADLGDVDGDGVVSLRDCTLISRFLAGGWDVTLK